MLLKYLFILILMVKDYLLNTIIAFNLFIFKRLNYYYTNKILSYSRVIDNNVFIKGKSSYLILYCNKWYFSATTFLIKVIKTYFNADAEKKVIVSENKAKSGIYGWTYLELSKCYINYLSNLATKYKQYYN